MPLQGMMGYPSGSMPGVIAPFRFYCQTVLPAVYDDSWSYYEAVCKMVEKLNEIITQSNIQSSAVSELQEFTASLQKQLDEFKAHGFDDYYKEQVNSWIGSKLGYIFCNVVKQVYFGLTLDGHFVAYIPDGWSDIIFDTGMDYALDTYGRLILRWDVDGSAKEANQSHETVRYGNGLTADEILSKAKIG